MENSVGSWLDDAVSDLARPDASGLRSFIRRIGADVATGRDAFRSLCRLYRLVNAFETCPEAVYNAIELLQNELGSVQARAARAIVAGAAVDQARELDDTSLDFVLQNWGLVDPDILMEGVERIGRTVWNRSPGRLVSLLEGEGGLSMVPKRTFEALSITELVNGLRLEPILAPAVLSHRPDVLTEPSFWSLDLVDIDNAFAMIAVSHELRSKTLAALVTAQRDDLALRAVHEFGSFEVLQAIGSELEQRNGSWGMDRWVEASVGDPSTIAQYLANGPRKPRALLVALARAIPPDAVPNDIDTDPWLIANEGVTGPLSESDAIYLNAYFLSRALGSRSRNAAELAELGFNTTYMAAASNRLSDEAWRLLEPRLPLSFFWFEWDQCHRIRSGVVDLFIERDLPPNAFARLSMDDQLFMSLADTAVRRKKGRQYLKRVLEAMKSESKKAFFIRIREVEKLLN
ncbi:hypothetical protein B0T40_15065 [Chromobacterium haemolyticum]|nr:hypothetical protein B0T40_15065 [Chromobacterium haemolyticum]